MPQHLGNSASPRQRKSTMQAPTEPTIESHGDDSDSSMPAPVAWNGPAAQSSSSSTMIEPFGAQQSSSRQSHLQGGASTFTPKHALTASSAGDSSRTPISYLNQNSFADPIPPVICDSNKKPDTKGKTAVDLQGPVGSGARNEDPNANVVFTTDMVPGKPCIGSHYVKIDGVLNSNFEYGMHELTVGRHWSQKLLGQTAAPPAMNNSFMTVFLCFDDLDDAKEAEVDVNLVSQDWKVSLISQAEFAGHSHDQSRFGDKYESKFFDGQVLLSAKWIGDYKDINKAGVREEVRKISESHGKVIAFAEFSEPSSDAWNFRVEYQKISEAKQVLHNVTECQSERIGPHWVVVARPVPGPQHPVNSEVPGTPQKQVIKASEVVFSPSGRTGWTQKDGRCEVQQPSKVIPKMTKPDSRDLYQPPRMRIYSAPVIQAPPIYDQSALATRSRSYGNAYSEDTLPQTVDYWKVMGGQDVRTTLMLRNLPNRWTCHDLKNCLDATSFGKYDFSYLRIDFQHNTNVGYAFVNFTDPYEIGPFFARYVDNDWDAGQPRRTAAVSYATIQGLDCLIEKFRNSSIMDEFPDFRPKIWYTDDDGFELTGKEKSFPAPNNSFKKKRSTDNAGSQGLFSPRTGRNGKHNRHSNYDRGTTHQLQEEAALFGAQQGPPTAPPYQCGAPLQIAANGFHDPVGALPLFNNYAVYPPVPVQYGPAYPPQFAFAAAGGYPYPHGPVNPASALRTRSNGRLAGFPKNVTVDPAYYGYTQTVPRSLGGENAQANGTFANSPGPYTNGNGSNGYGHQHFGAQQEFGTRHEHGVQHEHGAQQEYGAQEEGVQ